MTPKLNINEFHQNVLGHAITAITASELSRSVHLVIQRAMELGPTVDAAYVCDYIEALAALSKAKTRLDRMIEVSP